jgi:hypothetical protein
MAEMEKLKATRFPTYHRRICLVSLALPICSQTEKNWIIIFSEKDPMISKTINQYLTIENLKKFTNYSVWVLAYTKSGDGIKTNPMFCTTHEDGKAQTN